MTAKAEDAGAFDDVIVGAGSAGAVLASRLSEDPSATVCLIEAGLRDRNPLIHIPFSLAFIMRFKGIDWAYETTPQLNLDGRRLYWPRGKTLGGSSSINAMIYIRGVPADCDGWVRARRFRPGLVLGAALFQRGAGSGAGRGRLSRHRRSLWAEAPRLPDIQRGRDQRLCTAEPVLRRLRPAIPLSAGAHEGSRPRDRAGIPLQRACLLPSAQKPRRNPARVDRPAGRTGHRPLLEHDDDARLMLEGVRLTRRIAAAPSFACYRGCEVESGTKAQSDRDLLSFIRRNAESIYHPVGTCRMGPSRHMASVVDSALKVHGVEGLRVVDALVMPVLIRGNTNASTIMIAERAADLIRGRVYV
jgi:choline dehydrogenase-like flavoprotein